MNQPLNVKKSILAFLAGGIASAVITVATIGVLNATTVNTGTVNATTGNVTTQNTSSTNAYSLSVQKNDVNDAIDFIGYVTTTVNPNSIAVGQTTSSIVTITGASVGDQLIVTSPSLFGASSTIDLSKSYISSANTATINWRNTTTTAQDVGEALIQVRVISNP